MKIHHSVSQSLSAPDKTTNRPTTILPAKAGPSATSVDSVSISDTSRTLATGTQGTEAPFDAGRVSAIKEAIAAGQFKVNPEAVADKVLDSASQLLTGRG